MVALSRAVSGSEKTVSCTSPDIEVMNLFQGRKMQSFIRLVYEIAKADEVNIPDSEMQLILVKLRYMLGRYIPVSRDIDV